VGNTKFKSEIKKQTQGRGEKMFIFIFPNIVPALFSDLLSGYEKNVLKENRSIFELRVFKKNKS
jgi:hypothetical protein